MYDLSFGQPFLDEYTPALTRRSIKGTDSRTTAMPGCKTGRVHQLLSDLETDYFYYLEWAKNVTDIREQFPLDIDETKQIASTLGIKHPSNDGKDVVMTTDFLVTINDKYVLARTIKPAVKLSEKRVLEKFNIEKRYWESKGVGWGIVTENEIDKVLTENIKYFHRNRTYIEDENITKDVAVSIIKEIGLSDGVISKALKHIGTELELEAGQALSIFKCLVYRKVLKVDMLKKFRPSMKCSEVKLIGEV